MGAFQASPGFVVALMVVVVVVVETNGNSHALVGYRVPTLGLRLAPPQPPRCRRLARRIKLDEFPETARRAALSMSEDRERNFEKHLDGNRTHVEWSKTDLAKPCAAAQQTPR